MSLRARVMLTTTGLVAAVALTLIVVELHTLISVSLEHTNDRARMTGQFVKRYVLDRAERASTVAGQIAPLDERIGQWQRAIEEDAELPELLASTLAQTRALVEISVADGRGRILASSNPARRGQWMQPRLPLRKLLELGPLEKFQAVLGGQIDYEDRVELGVELPENSRREVVFAIQVLVSSVLLRDAIVPELRRSALASLPLLLLSVAMAWLTAQAALMPLKGISQTIDRIRSGETALPETVPSAREIAAVQEKLRLLGEQFRGAQEGAEQLRGSVERMIEGLEESILLFGADGRLVVCSEAAERLLHVSRQKVTGMRADILFPQDTPLGAVLAHALASRTPVKEVRAGRLLASLDFLPQGAFLLRLRDAEGRRMVESQLNLSSRLAAISRLTGGVAHEIKNPLNSIALRLELLRSRVLPELPEAQQEIDVISQEIVRLDRVVRTFLDFTRPVELQTEELDLARLAGELTALLGPEAERQGVALETEGLDEPARIRGDAGLLKQALLNVLRNGLEAMPAGGRLSVRLRRPDGHAELEIADTGPGIPAEFREKVFNLYFTTKKNGTGIGLAMTYRAVQLHNGSIEIGDAPGGGAAVRIRLPLEAEAAS
ncbi:MAG: ATP-binding protein [Bryobacteraceae bacterium]|nr:ATP-binding protein [Bryobacteraceae bacterium]